MVIVVLFPLLQAVSEDGTAVLPCSVTPEPLRWGCHVVPIHPFALFIPSPHQNISLIYSLHLLIPAQYTPKPDVHLDLPPWHGFDKSNEVYVDNQS